MMRASLLLVAFFAAGKTSAELCNGCASCEPDPTSPELVQESDCQACGTGQTWWPCPNNGLCRCAPTDPCEGVSCSGHSTCKRGNCACTGGWRGSDCDEEPCSSFGHKNCKGECDFDAESATCIKGNHGETSAKPGTIGNVVASYFVEWGIYGRNYNVVDIPVKQLTHIIYGFIPLCGPNDSLLAANPSGYDTLMAECADKQDFEVTIHDRWAALDVSIKAEKSVDGVGDQFSDANKGIFNQFVKLKKKHPHIKIVPSMGGWTLSDPFFSLGDGANRKVFVDSAIAFIVKYDFFDGIDIDWEFPGGGGANADLGAETDGQTYAVLMKELREGLDELSAATGREYELTSAIGAPREKIDAVDYRAAVPYMNYIFNMNYDFYGAWSGTLGHTSALHASDMYATTDGFYGSASIEHLLAAGVPANKLVMGVMMYARGWQKITGGTTSNPFTGTSHAPFAFNRPAPTCWEAGVLDYKAVKQFIDAPGWTYIYDEAADAPILFNEASGELITYENPRSAKAKRDYARKMGLAGVFSWEIDGDDGDIITAMNDDSGNVGPPPPPPPSCVDLMPTPCGEAEDCAWIGVKKRGTCLGPEDAAEKCASFKKKGRKCVKNGCVMVGKKKRKKKCRAPSDIKGLALFAAAAEAPTSDDVSSGGNTASGGSSSTAVIAAVATVAVAGVAALAGIAYYSTTNSAAKPRSAVLDVTDGIGGVSESSSSGSCGTTIEPEAQE